jgi:hypothetical protein
MVTGPTLGGLPELPEVLVLADAVLPLELLVVLPAVAPPPLELEVLGLPPAPAVVLAAPPVLAVPVLVPEAASLFAAPAHAVKTTSPRPIAKRVKF